MKEKRIETIAELENALDRQLYDKLMTLAKNAPDGGAKRNEYLSSLAQRLGENSEQCKAAVQRFDEAIDHARNLAKDGKVYKEADWENHDTQRKIATPNLANKERKLDTYGANINEKTLEVMTNNGRYVSYSNTFFRDFYDVLIKGSPRENWFAQES